MDHGFKSEHKTKTFRRKHRRTSLEPGAGKEFLDITSKTRSIKEKKINNCTSSKLKTFTL